MSATPRREFVERAREALVIAEQEDYEAGYYLTPSVEEQIKRVSIALQQTADETIERCAKVADSITQDWKDAGGYATKVSSGEYIAQSIRKLGESND